MHAHTPASRSLNKHKPAGSRHIFALLSALAAAFGAAFVLAPGALAGSVTAGGGFSSQSAFINTLTKAFIGYWASGEPAFPPAMRHVVDYWSRYHLIKAAFAALLLVVLVTLAVRLWRTLLGSGGRAADRQAGLACAWTLAALLAIGSVALLMANIQGTIAPFSSAISLLPTGTRDGQLATTIGQIRGQLTGYSNVAGHNPPAIELMVNDFGKYHAVIAVLTAIAALVLVGMSVATWRRLARTASGDRRTRRLLGAFGTLLALVAIAVVLVFIANTGTAANPAPALLAFFNGGW